MVCISIRLLQFLQNYEFNVVHTEFVKMFYFMFEYIYNNFEYCIVIYFSIFHYFPNNRWRLIKQIQYLNISTIRFVFG